MKQTITANQFHDAFHKMNRSENFSYSGLDALYNYFEQIEDETGIEIELDPIAICCEYAEYATLEDLKKDYDSIESFDDLEDETTVIYTNGYQDDEAPFLIVQF